MNVHTAFEVLTPTTRPVPILISIPHSGIEIPDDLIENYNSSSIQSMDDTDFFVDRLYSFASEMGITIIRARKSRYVIDLNRNPLDKKLYNDGRLITTLCPTTTFLGQPLYKSKAHEPNATEIDRRIKNSFMPYYHRVQSILNEMRQKNKKAILWDAHSIRRNVPTISKDPFPDFVLGTNDATSAEKQFINCVLKNLNSSDYYFKHNDPFKGGNITRYFGQPHKNINAIQLEMSKDLYMDDEEVNYHTARAQKVQEILRNIFASLIEQLT